MPYREVSANRPSPYYVHFTDEKLGSRSSGALCTRPRRCGGGGAGRHTGVWRHGQLPLQVLNKDSEGRKEGPKRPHPQGPAQVSTTPASKANAPSFQASNPGWHGLHRPLGQDTSGSPMRWQRSRDGTSSSACPSAANARLIFGKPPRAFVFMIPLTEVNTEAHRGERTQLRTCKGSGLYAFLETPSSSH